MIEDNIDSQLDQPVESTPDTQTETIQQEQIIEQDQKQPQDHTDENNG